MQLQLSTVSKAIAGGLVAALVAVLAKHGLNVSADVSSAVDTLLTVVLAYLFGHVVVFLAPKNKA